jgi:peptide/nickel transport system permease protein
LIKLGSSVGLLLALVAVVFLLQRVSGIDPVTAKLGPSAPAEMRERAQQELGFDDPLPVQFGRYVADTVRGDLGVSLRTGEPVRDDIAAALPATIELTLAILLIGAVVAVLLAVLSVRSGPLAPIARVLISVFASAPGYLVALIGLLVLYRNLRWLPAAGRSSIRGAPTGPTGLLVLDSLLAGDAASAWDAIRHLLLPAAAAALAPAAAVARVLRSGLLDEMTKDYTEVARMLGRSETSVLFRSCLRNAAGPALSMTGLIVASLLAGGLIVEQIVAWPGIGTYAFRSIESSDFVAVAGVTLVVGVIYLSVNALAELLQRRLDPRLGARASSSSGSGE